MRDSLSSDGNLASSRSIALAQPCHFALNAQPVFNDIEDVLETPEELSHKAGPETCTPKPPEKTRENKTDVANDA
ncbi:Uncharacterized protein APZ42_006379, partial [Daphnia magna]